MNIGALIAPVASIVVFKNRRRVVRRVWICSFVCMKGLSGHAKGFLTGLRQTEVSIPPLDEGAFEGVLLNFRPDVWPLSTRAIDQVTEYTTRMPDPRSSCGCADAVLNGFAETTKQHNARRIASWKPYLCKLWLCSLRLGESLELHGTVTIGAASI